MKKILKNISRFFSRPVCSHIFAGLGNNMFQYAAGYAYARHHNKKQVLFNKTHELIKTFNIKNEVIYQPIKHNIFDESDGENHLRDFINTPGFDFLTGYFQDGKLFQEYREELLNIFQFKNNPGEQNERYAHHIKNTNSVSVHIRRTDYLTEFPKSVLPATYYRNALTYIFSKVKNIHLFIFSDDIEWAKNSLKLDCPHTFITCNQAKNDAPWDMYLMSLCKHNIIANSSFSWWGAWLNNNPNKIVISPKTWIIDAPKHIKITKHIIPNDWIALPTHD